MNDRSIALVPVEDARHAAFDYYALVRNAYLQRREALIEDSHEVPSDASDDLYQLVPDDTAFAVPPPIE